MQYVGSIPAAVYTVGNMDQNQTKTVPAAYVDPRGPGKILWSTTPVPSSFSSDLADFLGVPGYAVGLTQKLSLTTGDVGGGDNAFLQLTFRLIDGRALTKKYYGNAGVGNDSIVVDEPIDAGGAVVTGLDVKFGRDSGATDWAKIDNVKLKVYVDAGGLVVAVTCSGTDLEGGVCRAYCTDANRAIADTCYEPMMAYCFPATSDRARMPIGTSAACQSYFKDYTGAHAPTSELDDAFERYCGAYRGNMALLFNSGAAPTEQNLCACHLLPQFDNGDPTDIYKDYYDQLTMGYSGIAPVPGVNYPCYLPACASSPYKSSVTTGQCAAPECLNVVNFTNEGDLVIDIDQNADCVSSTGGCAADGDCPSGQVCRSGYCQRLCASDADCGSGQTCSGGVCATAVPAGCTADANCAAGQVCRSGQCVAEEPAQPCTSDANCAAGQVCRSGQCVAEAVPCTSDTQCAAGQVCRSGQCVAEEAPAGCTGNSDCLSDYECKSGQCVEKAGLAPWEWGLIILGILVVVALVVVLIAKKGKAPAPVPPNPLGG